MTLRTELWPIAASQYGFVTTRDARDLGYSAVELAKLASREKLERISQGLYRFPELPQTARDDYMRAVLATGAPDAILSHDTALLVHDLCDIIASAGTSLACSYIAITYRPASEAGGKEFQ